MQAIWEVFSFFLFFSVSSLCISVRTVLLLGVLKVHFNKGEQNNKDENCKSTHSEVKDVSSELYTEVLNDKSM